MFYIASDLFLLDLLFIITLPFDVKYNFEKMSLNEVRNRKNVCHRVNEFLNIK
jgi:hypothetical protein